MAKQATKTARTARSRVKSTPRATAERNAALDAAAADLATVPDPQSGGAQVVGDKPTRSAAKKALDAQFGAADAAGDPVPQDVADATLSRAMRGW